MSVRVDHQAYSMRGTYCCYDIFKNPLFIIENSYKSISLIFHGFIATVEKDYFLKEELAITPLRSMLYLICLKLPREGVRFLGKESVDDILRKGITNPVEYGEGSLSLTLIRVDALIRCYKEARFGEVNTNRHAQEEVTLTEKTTQYRQLLSEHVVQEELSSRTINHGKK